MFELLVILMLGYICIKMAQAFPKLDRNCDHKDDAR